MNTSLTAVQILTFRLALRVGPFLLALCACNAEVPDFVLEAGLGVLASGGQDAAWLDILFADIKAAAPDEDVANWDRLDGMTLEIRTLAEVQALCGPNTVGCTSVNSIAVANLPCNGWNQNLAGIIAHEVGHALGHDNTHLYEPWYGNYASALETGTGVSGGLEPEFMAWMCAQ